MPKGSLVPAVHCYARVRSISVSSADDGARISHGIEERLRGREKRRNYAIDRNSSTPPPDCPSFHPASSPTPLVTPRLERPRGATGLTSLRQRRLFSLHSNWFHLGFSHLQLSLFATTVHHFTFLCFGSCSLKAHPTCASLCKTESRRQTLSPPHSL